MLLADLFEAIVPLLGAIFWVIWQVISAKAQQGPAKPNPQQPAEADPAGQAQGLRSEVDEFLRGVEQAQRAEAKPGEAARDERQPPKRPGRPSRRPRIEVLVDEPGDESTSPERPVGEPLRPRRDADRPKRGKRAARDPSSKSKLESSPLEPSKLESSKLAEQAARLGEVVAQADERVEARLHAKFDHDVGSLSSSVTDRVTDDAPEVSGSTDKLDEPTPAEKVAAMLADPEGIRNAVILNEILTRRS